MEYYYIKLGRSNSLLPYWLEEEGKKNPFRCPCVAIYFYNISVKEYNEIESQEDFEALKERHGIPKSNMYYNQSFVQQIQPFIDSDNTKNMRIITFENGFLYILEPNSEVDDIPDDMLDQYHKDLDEMRTELKNKFKWKLADLERYDAIKNSIAKVRKVKILAKVNTNIPYVLRSLSSVQYLTSGTFRRINPETFFGIHRALGKVLNEEEKVEKIPFDKILELLSPHQIETLVFLIFLNARIFSPAWRAGSLPGIDITGINYSSKTPITLGNPIIRFTPKVEVNFQVKRKRRQSHFEEADWTIAISSIKQDRKVLTAEWLYSAIKKQEKTIEWLEHSLKWYIEGSEFESIMELVK